MELGDAREAEGTERIHAPETGDTAKSDEIGNTPKSTSHSDMRTDKLKATDDSAMFEKYIDLEARDGPPLEVESRQVYTWHIEDWHALGEKAFSPVFEVSGHRWQLLLYPEGNPANHSRGTIALYLKALPDNSADDEATNDDAPAGSPSSGATVTRRNKGWHVCATFALALWNPDHPSVFVCQSARNRFDAGVSDWGYSEFAPLRSAFVTQPQAEAPLISKAVNATVYLATLNDPTGVLWHDFVDYNSRDETGYTGLTNQGATCYLNSLLQSLYFTKVFRQTVYAIPHAQGVVGGMQRLFYQLATSADAVATQPLTRAFGWDSADAFQQHDVQEMCRVLMDSLETKMKGTAVEGALSDIFVGKMKSYVKCLNVDFESSRIEDFWDIQLNVKGMRDVTDSFRHYVAKEVLEGENQYQAEGYGLQDAEKGVIFQTLPPVLHLQLKRYDYDWMRDVEVKINDRYEFPLELDLGEFVEADENWQYELHGVLVHSGDLNAGHYYALLKPEAGGKWYRFDDDRVTQASLREVMDENFGGTDGSALHRVTSAYMLVYIRKEKIEFVLPSAGPGGVNDEPPAEVAEALEEETIAEETRRRQLAERQQFVTVQTLSPAQFRHHRGVGTVWWYSLPSPVTQEMPVTLRLKRQTPISTLREETHAESLWLVPTSRYSRAPVRMHLLRSNQHESHPVMQLAAWASAREPVVFVEDKPGDLVTQRLVFVKVWDHSVPEIRGAGTYWIDTDKPISATLGTPLVWLEPPPPEFGRLCPLPEAQPAGDFLENGDAVIIQLRDGPSPVDYYTRLLQSVVVMFRPWNTSSKRSSASVENSDAEDAAEAGGDNDVVKILVSTADPYESLVNAVAEQVKVDPERLQLWTADYDWRRGVPLRSDSSNLDTLWNQSGGGSIGPSGLWRVLDRPLTEFEQLIELPIATVEGTTITQPRTALLKPSDTLQTALKQLGLEDHDRQWATMLSQDLPRPQAMELEQNIGAEELAELSQVLVGKLPDVERKARATPGARLTPAFHFSKSPWHSWGTPFVVAIVPGEPLSALRQRIQATLGLSDRTSEKIRFAAVGPTSTPRYMEDADIIVYDALGEDDELGLDHPNLTRQLPQHSIVIA